METEIKQAPLPQVQEETRKKSWHPPQLTQISVLEVTAAS